MWALPSAPQRAELALEIAELARRAGTVPFEPHITLVGSVPDPSRARTAVGRLAAATAPFDVELVELVDTDEHFRCIVAGVNLAGGLARLHRDVCTALGTQSHGFRPHLSLLYGDLPEAERAQLSRHVSLALPSLMGIDAVSLVDTDGDDTRRWSTLATWPLRGA